jgi:hypothetical protein
MAEEPMTLIERLRNPQWVHGPGMNSDAVLDREQTRDDMTEAADTIERLTAEPFKAQELWTAVIQANAHRANLMPTEHDALIIAMQAYQRLKDLGWHEGMYAPKDGSIFETVSNGSTGTHDCYYSGEWPNGYWNFMDGGDVYPTSAPPVLYRLKPDKKALTRG